LIAQATVEDLTLLTTDGENSTVRLRTIPRGLIAARRRGCASTVKHPLDARVHLFLFDEFTLRNLVDPDLYLLLEPLVVRKQAGDGLLDRFIGSPSGF
jgi:hypothetical protein